MGGMTTASLLAQVYNKKVLVLERHFQAGGFTHSFGFRGFSWDAGLHYVGDMQEGKFTRKVMDYITSKKVSWQKMPDPFEVYMTPEITIRQSSDPEAFRQTLKDNFLQEKRRIDQYFRDLEVMAEWRRSLFFSKEFPEWCFHLAEFFTPRAKEISRWSINEYFNDLGASENLRAILLGQWGDYGLPPKEASAIVHMLIVSHYLEGAHYPQGGGASIAKAISQVLETHGGKILTKRNVTELKFEANRVVALVCENEGEREVYEADQFFSNIGVVATYRDLVPKDLAPDEYFEVEKIKTGYSVFTLFIGFKESPQKLGFQGENYWIYNTNDHDFAYERAADILEGKVWSGYLSFPSLKDDKHTGGHTAEFITPIPYEMIETWKLKEKSKEEFQSWKEGISKTILEFIEEKFPGFKDIVELTSLATPFTYEEMSFHRQGEIYSVPAIVDRFLKYKSLRAKTPIENLFITGADVSSHGIIGSMMGGFLSASASQGVTGLLQMGSKIMAK